MILTHGKNTLIESIQRRYETLHEDLLYTDQKQNFEDAVNTFEEINRIFAAIDE